MNGRDAGHRSPGRHGVLRDPGVVLFRRIRSLLRIRTQHRLKPVRVSVAESPGHLRTKVERLATALQLPPRSCVWDRVGYGRAGQWLRKTDQRRRSAQSRPRS